MGIIKDGTISGNLPSNNMAFAIHYPAYPSSLDRAIETLGGTEAIAKVRSSDLNKLELHFRPEDPYSHPAFGKLYACNNFLLKISKKKVRNAHNGDNGGISQSIGGAEHENISSPDALQYKKTEEDQEHLVADLVAHMRDAYRFTGMVDYQHVVAVHANAARQKKRNWTDYEKDGLMDVDQEDLMILIPPLFSLKDIPGKVVLKPCASNSLRRRNVAVGQHRWERAIEPSLALDFGIKDILVMLVPKKVNWERYIPENSEQWQWQKAVCELFEERPIWIKDSLSERLLDKGLEFGGNMLRRLLFRAAYYFSNGPFLRFWIRKGYDPRKDPESRIYQKTDFRVPPPLRSYCEANTASGLKQRWEDICAFRTFPLKCQTALQLFELADDYIQQEIRKPASLSECSCATGWFPLHVLHSLRLCVAVRFLSVYPKAGAEPFLKTASARFERSKISHMFPKNSKVTEDMEQANKEVMEDQDMESNDDEDDEDDEIEDDNIEEVLDPEQIGPLAGNLSPPDLSYTDHGNMSRNYLQELFGSFPLNATGENEVPAANNSDGEYEIYEQYSDGNYSDGDEY
ncbi:OLC1v1014559C1 [Oldenlandia corymbosa var. corymbosa]|uniref:OLC1v1014559C1 n=1 Tax=Oldenlandia corymbosa var. corymbosa TaxID=529605 RepID=A0AAV1E4L1_OLDCO|nr:OLC1v1014559C1 [Oldenlandia corymbosa var. corymbosa]